MRSIIFISFFSCLLSACATGKLILNDTGDSLQQTPAEVPDFTIYAVGDAGEINAQSTSVLAELNSIASDDPQPGLVLFLGDNIYPSGFPSKENTEAHQDAISILMSQIDGLQNYKGKILFIPGNHDWNESRAGGLQAIRREGDFLDRVDTSRIKLLPQNGCSGPEVIEVNKHLVLLIIDSQWWMQDWTREFGMNEGCPTHSREDFIKTFHDQVMMYRDRQIIVAMHHPLFSLGSHGGHFTLKDHLFPLTAAIKWLYLPLPVIGSIYPFYRTIFGHEQDLKNRKYVLLRDALLRDLNYRGQMIFLAGHEHCLQYISKNGRHFLVSGSGSKQTAIANNKDLVFGDKAGGFMQLDFFKNGSCWLSVYAVDPKTGTAGRVFSRYIIDKTGL